jgi:hypothetical protein
VSRKRTLKEDVETVQSIKVKLGSILLRHPMLADEVQEVQNLLRRLNTGRGVGSVTDNTNKKTIQRQRKVGTSISQEGPMLPHIRGKYKTTLSLTRACRIALMESSGAATSEEIYDRIVRRGSFDFRRYKYPLLGVIKALAHLAERKDAVCIRDRERQYWKLSHWDSPKR